ncbi:aldo/keto reductase [Actinoplanes sp. CA-015351]|uniref:aldo/keto reductase n=1 Tax=Actinoplanes sp. CA-015351 TaxID=3239897 RepID=UPI003D9780C2
MPPGMAHGNARQALREARRERGARSGRRVEREAAQYLTAAGLAVVKTLEEIAHAHDTEVPTVALSWLRGRPDVAAPIASARTVEQLPALVASATFESTAEERAALDDVTGPGAAA